MAFDTSCRTAASSCSGVLRLTRVVLGQRRLHGLEERHIVSDGRGFVAGRAQRKRPRQFRDDLDEPLLAVVLLQDVLTSRRKERELLARRAGGPLLPFEAVQHVARDAVLLQQQRDGLPRVVGRTARAATLGVGGEGVLQLVGQAQVINHQTTGLVAEHAIHPRNRLHQPMALHRLVGIHRVQAGRIEPGEPHVPHDDDAERVAAVLEAVGELRAPVLVADVRLPVGAIVRAAGHHHLDDAVLGPSPPPRHRLSRSPSRAASLMTAL